MSDLRRGCGVGESMGFVYCIQAGDTLTVGQTTNLQRARGDIGFAAHRESRGHTSVVRNVFLRVSMTRVEDEATVLSLAEQHFGEATLGKGRFRLSAGTLAAFLGDCAHSGVGESDRRRGGAHTTPTVKIPKKRRTSTPKGRAHLVFAPF